MKSLMLCSFFLLGSSLFAQHFEREITGIGPEAKATWAWDSVVSMEILDANHRVYRFADGRTLSQSAKSPINYRDKSGDWRMISAAPETMEDGSGWLASNQPFPVELSKEGNLRFNLGDQQVVYGAVKPAAVGPLVAVAPGSFREPLPNGGYREFEFRVNAVKSSSILPVAPGGDWVWSREVSLPAGAAMRQAEFPEGALEAVDGAGTVLSKILPLVVSDAQGNAEAFAYEMKPLGKGLYLLEARIPSAWLEDPSRVYPVEVDPLITGPTALWGGAFMPSCLMPTYYVDSISVVVPAEVTITGVFVTGSYYASPFSGAVMADAEMYYSSACGQTPGLTVAPPTGNLAGTGYNEDTEYRNPLTCCLAPSCSQQSFWLRMHLGRSFGPPGCNFTYVYHDASSQWPFSAFVEGRTVESAAVQWQVLPASLCGTDCDLTLRSFVRYGVPPYTINHPWASAAVTAGNPSANCNIPLVDEEMDLVRANCPQTCFENPALAIPFPTITDQCGNTVSGLPVRTVSIRETPDITATPSLLEVCSGESAEIQFSSCVPGTIINWQGSDGTSGTGAVQITTQNNSADTLVVTYTATASANNCQAPPEQATIHVFPNPIANASIPEVVIIQSDAVFSDSTNYQGGNSALVEWLLEDGTVLTGNPAQTQFSIPGLYQVCMVVESNYGCRDTLCDTVEVIPPTVPLPNVVTPNGDGVNDALSFQYLEFFSPAMLTVFNRWGNVVYQNEDYQNDWVPDGLSEGTYFYELVLFDGTAETSSLNIFKP